MNSEERFEAIAAKLLNDEAVSRKKMFSSAALTIGGKIFAMQVKGNLVVKLPRERIEALILSGQGERFDPGHGRLMKEWVAVAPTAGDEWLALAEAARDFVGSKK
jgi:hypothetical protein